MTKITALIPARGGSKGVPHKNIRELNGFPLISYSIAACLECEMIDRVIVSTDSEKIAKIAKQYGADIPFIRPSQYAQDQSKDYDVLKHFFDLADVDEVAYMRPTTPFRIPSELARHIKFFFENRDKMSGLRSMHELPEPPYKSFKIDSGYCNGFFKDFKGIKDYTNLPRQMFPKAYQPNGYIDICKREQIYSSESAFGTKIMPVITENVTEVDMEYEFKLLEFQSSLNKNPLLTTMQERFKDDKYKT
jgi:CMP-N,N'-diacetyllegionaminic acid synthase|tara:strand:+ start:1009 stop:1752 length:744 start_codon:yes stop_codon:yes gene_type:complete